MLFYVFSQNSNVYQIHVYREIQDWVLYASILKPDSKTVNNACNATVKDYNLSSVANQGVTELEIYEF